MLEEVKNMYDEYQQRLYQSPSSIYVMVAGANDECLYNSGLGEFSQELYTAGDKWWSGTAERLL